MPSVEALILRHYFELQGFLVRQCLPKTPQGLESMQVVNPNPTEPATADIITIGETTAIATSLKAFFILNFSRF